MFVGREREIRRVDDALASGRNVIVRGRYGVGRTALVREVATRADAHRRFVFADFSLPPSSLATSVLAQLSRRGRRAIPERRGGQRTARKVARLHPPKRIDRVVLVLDDIAKVTRPKLELIRTLRTSPDLAFIGIVERFVPDGDLMHLRVALAPAIVISLDSLGRSDSIEYFSNHAAAYGLPWSEGDIEMLARTMHGYPLEMAGAVKRARRRLRERGGDR